MVWDDEEEKIHLAHDNILNLHDQDFEGLKIFFLNLDDEQVRLVVSNSILEISSEA